MPRTVNRSLLRLSIRAGEIAVRDSRLVRIEACLDGGRVRVRDLATGQFDEAPIGTLQARSSISNGAAIDVHLEASRSTAEIPWSRAAAREKAVTALFEGSGPWGARAKGIAEAHGVSRRTLYRWLARYRDAATTSSLIPMPRGTPPGARRLDSTRETLVNRIIEQEYLSRSRPTVEEIVRIVERRCVERKFKPVSRNAIRARIHQLDPRMRTRTRYGAKVASSTHAATPGSFPVVRVLQSVQIDHALADVIVVDERDRLAICRLEPVSNGGVDFTISWPNIGTVSNGGACNNSRVDSSCPRTPQVIYAHASDSRVCGRRSQDGNTPSFGRRRMQ
jgi:transposase-like protein